MAAFAKSLAARELARSIGAFLLPAHNLKSTPTRLTGAGR
jgi:hypothetical protein